MPALSFMNKPLGTGMNASPSPPINHDWIFKNLVQDYPQAALAFFPAASGSAAGKAE